MKSYQQLLACNNNLFSVFFGPHLTIDLINKPIDINQVHPAIVFDLIFKIETFKSFPCKQESKYRQTYLVEIHQKSVSMAQPAKIKQFLFYLYFWEPTIACKTDTKKQWRSLQLSICSKWKGKSCSKMGCSIFQILLYFVILINDQKYVEIVVR